MFERENIVISILIFKACQIQNLQILNMILMKRNPRQYSPFHFLVSLLDSVLERNVSKKWNAFFKLLDNILHMHHPIGIIKIELRSFDVDVFLLLKAHHLRKAILIYFYTFNACFFALLVFYEFLVDLTKVQWRITYLLFVQIWRCHGMGFVEVFGTI